MMLIQPALRYVDLRSAQGLVKAQLAQNSLTFSGSFLVFWVFRDAMTGPQISRMINVVANALLTANDFW